MHRALVERASPSIRRLAGCRRREVQFHRFLRNERVSVAEMAARVGERTGERSAGRDVVVIEDTCEIALGGGELRGAGFGPVGRGEGDIYELFASRPEGVHVLTRSAHDRKLVNKLSLSETVAGFGVSERVARVIPAIPGRRERTATFELRFGKIEIKAPTGRPPGMAKSLVLSAVDVREVNAPPGLTPIHWLLLTSHDVADARRAGEIVDLYKSRWWIEQLFRTLKSAGFRIEESELGDPKAFINFAGLATVAAVTLMQLVKARDGGSGQTIADCFEPDDKSLLQALSTTLAGKTDRQKNPHPTDDLAFASWVIARLGGWTGYYGKPGPEVMRYGLDRFHAIKLGAQLAKNV